MTPMALDAIIFDFDGVIADSERLHLRAYQEVLAGEGLPLSDEAYYTRYLGYDDVGVLRALASDHGVALEEPRLRELIARKGVRYDALTAEGEMLFPGAADFIRQAAAAVPVAIASGALTHEVEDVLDRAGLRGLFSVIVGADQTERSKPSPDPYLEAFARLQMAAGRRLDPRRTVAIEDSKWGLMSARDAGLRTVGVTNTYPADELGEAAELIRPGLHALDLGTLDRLCEEPA
jgi:beta-phosphoglucomutase